MNKIINFIGNTTINKINNIKSTRKETLNIDDSSLIYHNQITMINTMYLLNTYTCNDSKLLKQEIDKKINGYKAQDIKKKIYEEILLITFNDLIEKMVSSKLKCKYCSKNVIVLYKNIREPMQWTLDRIDNNKCHSYDNTIICCLKCNLQRRRIDMNKFLFTKKLTLVKTSI
jgi:hypothetical protein